MTETSPSSTKVDDFLSSLSQISQDRIREDQQRQSSLRRNINDLKSNSNVSTPLKPTKPAKYSFTPATYKMDSSSTPSKEPFKSSRYNFDDDEEEEPPKLPTRPSEDDENPPPLPTRKVASKDNSFNINIVQPKARKDPIKPIKPTPRVFNSSPSPSPMSNDGYRSFSQIEHSIKHSSKTDENNQQEIKKAPPPKPNKPKTPTKPIINESEKKDWMSSLSNSKAISPTIKHNIPKPSYQSALWATQAAKTNSRLKDDEKLKKPTVIAKPSYLDNKRKSIDEDIQPPPKPTRPNPNGFSTISKGPPPKPSKPPASVYEEKDSELLKSTILKLSSSSSSSNTSKLAPLKPAKPSIEQYTKAEKSLLNDVKSNLSSSTKVAPLKPVKPSLSKYAEQDTQELQSQLQRLKSTKPQINNQKVNHIQKASLTPPVYKHEGRSTSSLTPSKPASFEDKLSSILRASTLPEVRSSPNPMSTPLPTRAHTETTIKSKRQDTTNSKGMSHLSKSRAKGPKRKLPKNMQSTTTTTKNEPEPEVEPTTDFPKLVINKKAPPPINKLSKPKPIGDLKPSRNISGEIFI
ncbi:hypothetical protein DFJ63DRAFT_312367 [Scheffersomyces coipomensis]|uniref:uncharacterized protein n=1 Tax=Scheffersomyces coipomensis TaxID=1788519 RepID=UPI00315C9747